MRKQQRKNRLPIEYAHAFDRIVEPIYNGKLDFSKKEKVIYVFLTGLSGYFSYESAKFFLDTGGEGTRYLPLGNFSKSFGGITAFSVNIALNWYFTMDTIINTRHSIHQYKLAKELGLPTFSKKKVAKLTFALLFSVIAGSVMGILDYEDHTAYNAIVTANVNIILSYIGTLALITAPSKIKNKFKQWRSPSLKLKAFESRIVNHMNDRTRALNRLPNKEKCSLLSTDFKIYKNFILSPNKSNASLKNTVTYIGIAIAAHVIMQGSDKLALWGFFWSTVKDTSDLFHIKDMNTGLTVGSIIFIPFAALSIKVVWDTTQAMIDLGKTNITNAFKFYKKPDWSKETSIKLGIMLPIALLSMAGYFIAYISANTSLQLNAENGWNDWWNVVPTTIGAATFNGFAFLEILIPLTSTLMGYALYSPEKRKVLDRHNQVMCFFKSYPDAINTLVKEEVLLFPPRPSRFSCRAVLF